MKRILKIYGPYVVAIVVGIPVLSGVITGFGPGSFDSGEVIGYSSMIVAMSLIYFAVKNHRDKINNGRITFGESMKLGTAIATLGGIAWGIYNFVFVTWIMPDFNEQYIAHIEGLEIGTPAFEAKFNAAMNGSDSFMYTPIGGTIVMFLTVFLIGFLITVISSLILKSNTEISHA